MRTRTHRPADRRGFALAVALFALVVIGALIAGVFFASTQEYRVGSNSLTQQRAQAAAEFGLNRTVDLWDSQFYRTLATTGGSSTTTFDTLGANFTVRVTRLSNTTFLVLSEGRAGTYSANDARRRSSAVIRLDMPAMQFLGALTLRGTARIGGSSMISGMDQNPAGWNDCPTPSHHMPGVVVDSSHHINFTGNSYRVSGYPDSVAARPAAADTNTYFRYGDQNWNDIVRARDITIPSGNPGQIRPESLTTPTRTCNGNVITNWGSIARTTPAGICEGYYPIIYAENDLTLSSGSGQGILLVNGDLEVQGGFRFYGPVIVRGTLRTTGDGGHFYGGVMAANVEMNANIVLGDAEVRYSQCAINAALLGAATPSFLTQRAWAEVF